ncbi:MAG: hypothetical protein V3R89_05715 [Thermoanaerobaculia bacterium]
MRGTYAAGRPVLNSYLVRQRDRKRRRELALLLLATLPVALGLLGYVWLNLELLDIGYEIHRLERTLEAEEQLHRKLLMEAAYLASPQRIEARASEELGMVPASLEQLIFLEEVP